MLKGPLGSPSGPAEIITNLLCAVKPAGESKGSVVFPGGIWGVGHKDAFSVLIAEIMEGAESWRGSRGRELLGTHTGAGGHTAYLHDVFFCCVWGGQDLGPFFVKKQMQ